MVASTHAWMELIETGCSQSFDQARFRLVSIPQSREPMMERIIGPLAKREVAQIAEQRSRFLIRGTVAKIDQILDVAPGSLAALGELVQAATPRLRRLLLSSPRFGLLPRRLGTLALVGELASCGA
jgi:hypothetical protein